MYAAVRDAVGSRATVIAGTTNYNTAESIELTREADDLGVDAFLLTVPYYNNPPQEGLYQHFKAIAGVTRKPCILYNVPSRTVRNMEAATTIRLSAIDNIVGVKEASANYDQITKILQGASPGFRLWSGNDSDTLPILAMGGYGVVSVAAHFTGLQIKEMIASYLAGDHQQAAAIHQRLLPLVNSLFVVSSPIPLKYLLNHIGFNVGKPRLPLVELDEQTAAQITATLAGYNIDLPLAAAIQ